MAAENFEEHGLVDAQDVDNAQEVENVPELENALEAEEEEEEEEEEADVELEIEEEDVELEMEQEDVELETEQEIVAEIDRLQEADVLPETVGSQEKDVPEVDLNQSDEVPVEHNHLKVPEEKRWPGWPGENVFRMLVPVQMVGGIIGRKGEFIKKVCEETKARIKILDGPPGTTERTVMVSAKEEPDLDIPPALDGLLRIHKRIVDVDSDPADAQPGKSKTASTRLLVAATQAGSLIGKQGATIKTIQDGSNCTIRVLSGEHLPVCALPDDSVVEILGDPTGLHKAVELIAKHLRKFLVDRSVVGVFETQMQMPTARPNQNMPPPQSWRPPPQGFPVSAGPGSGYGAPPPYMPPPRQYDNYYPPPRQDDNYYAPPDVAMDKMPRGGPPYTRDAALGGLQQHQSIVSKITQNMQIPLLYADAVIGTSGANISYIRRASGATIAIQETRGAPNEMTVEINGTSSQVQAAQQLIQNVMADAAAAAAQNSGTGPPGQAYNSYQHGPVYASPPSNSGGHSHGPPGDYNSVYGGNYGY